jgi:hypothetical protein
VPGIAKKFLIVQTMSVSKSWSAQREALAVEALRASGHLRLQVRGESMLPTLWPGDIAQITACSVSDVGRGEIVLAFHDGRFFLHRFLDRGDHGGFITRGDSMPAPDPPFPVDALVGKLVRTSRDGQSVAPELRLWSRMIGLLLCRSSFARRAALRLRGSRDSQPLPSAEPESA